MKNITCGFIIVIILTALITVVSASNTESFTAYVTQFRIFADGRERYIENPVVTINDRTYISLREISEVLGMEVIWNEAFRQIFIYSPQYIEYLRNRLRRFEQNGLWGFTDADGNIIIEPQYYSVQDFHEGLAYVRGTEDNPEKSGFIDLTGTLVIPRSSAQVGWFSEGFAFVSVHEWAWLEGYKDLPEHVRPFLSSAGAIEPFIYINREGKDVFGQEFTKAYNFSEGFAVVLPVGSRNKIFINHEGKNIFNMEFKEAVSFEDGYARVILLDGTWTHIDTSGNIVDKGGW